MLDRANLPAAVSTLITHIDILIHNQYALDDTQGEFQLTIRNLTFDKLLTAYKHENVSLSAATWIFLAGRQDILNWIYARANKDRASQDFLLHWAVLCRQTGHTITELKKFPHLLSKCHNYETPLHIAVRENNPDMARLLGYPENQTSPLLLAVAQNKTAMVRLFIEMKANVNGADGDKDTPLHLACRNANTDIIAALVAAGADPFKQNRQGDSPLHLVLRDEKNGTQLFQALQINSIGTHINDSNRAGLTPLAIAAKTGSRELVQRWLEQEKPSQENINLSFREAVKQGHADIVTLLAPRISTIKTEFENKPGSAICIAAYRKFTAVVSAICTQRLLVFIAEKEKEQHKPNSIMAEKTAREILAAKALIRIVSGENLDLLKEHEAQFKRGELKTIKDNCFKFCRESYQPPENMTIESQKTASPSHGNDSRCTGPTLAESCACGLFTCSCLMGVNNGRSCMF